MIWLVNITDNSLEWRNKVINLTPKFMTINRSNTASKQLKKILKRMKKMKIWEKILLSKNDFIKEDDIVEKVYKFINLVHLMFIYVSDLWPTWSNLEAGFRIHNS